jgi:hypothetical protein
VSIKTRATIEDLYKVEGKAELVDGEIVHLPPSGDDPGFASLEIATSLRAYARRTRRGRAYGDGTGFHVDLPHREAFSPDAAYHIGARTGLRFPEGAPAFAVEIRSENDSLNLSPFVARQIWLRAVSPHPVGGPIVCKDEGLSEASRAHSYLVRPSTNSDKLSEN